MELGTTKKLFFLSVRNTFKNCTSTAGSDVLSSRNWILFLQFTAKYSENVLCCQISHPLRRLPKVCSIEPDQMPQFNNMWSMTKTKNLMLNWEKLWNYHTSFFIQETINNMLIYGYRYIPRKYNCSIAVLFSWTTWYGQLHEGDLDVVDHCQ